MAEAATEDENVSLAETKLSTKEWSSAEWIVAGRRSDKMSNLGLSEVLCVWHMLVSTIVTGAKYIYITQMEPRTDVLRRKRKTLYCHIYSSFYL